MKQNITAILFFCAVTVYAQSPLGLHYPLGVPILSVTGASAGMGGSGVAVAEEYFGTALNPANAGIGERAAFGAMVSYGITGISDNGERNTVSGYQPKLLSLILPLGNKFGNVSFSMQKRYDANLNFYTTDTRNEHSYTIELHQKGGLTAWQAGWAYRLKNGIGLGMVYERLYFTKDFFNVFESTLKYNLDNGLVVIQGASVHETIITSFASDGIRFGMQIPVHEKVTLGAAFEYILLGSDNAREIYDYSRSDERFEPEEETFSVTLPPSLNIGAAYRYDRRLLFAADAWTTLWNAYENNRFDNNAGRPTYGISTGARFIPAAGRLVSTYPEQIHYSAGLRYNTMPVDRIGAHEYALTLGVGLPIPNDGGIIDIALDLGRRTDARYSGYGENLIRIQLGINGGRSWFQQDASHGF